MPKIFQAQIYTDTQIEELEVEEMVFPYSDNQMKYDGLQHAYIPQESAFTSRGIDIRSKLKVIGVNNVNGFMHEVSRKFYQYVLKRGALDGLLKRKYIIAKRGILSNYGNMFEYRTAIVDAMVELGDYLADNGDLSQVAGVDFSENISIDINTLRYEERDYPNGFRNTMTSLGLNYVGDYKNIDISEVGKEW